MALELDLGKKYLPTYKQSLAHAVEELYTLFGGAMGGGKTVWLCNSAIFLCLQFPRNRGFIGRWENKTFRNTTLLTLQEYLTPDIITRQHISEQYYDFFNGSRLYYGGLKPSTAGDSLDRLKRAPDLGFFAVDEASEIPYEYFLMLASRLRLDVPGIRYRGLLASNPEPGWLSRLFIDSGGLANHKFISALPKDNPHLPTDYEGRLRELFPAPWIKRYLGGDWAVMMKGNYVFPYAWVKAAVERTLDKQEPVNFGADIAGGGRNETVLVVRWGPVARVLFHNHESSTMKTATRIANHMDEERPDMTGIDAVGVGKGVYDRLKELGYSVEAYIGGGAARDSSRFLNRRAEDHWLLRDELEAGEIDLPDDSILISQLCNEEYEKWGDKKIKIVSKKESRKPSPDRKDALVQASSKYRATRKKSGRVFSHDRRKEEIRKQKAVAKERMDKANNLPIAVASVARKAANRVQKRKGRVIAI